MVPSRKAFEKKSGRKFAILSTGTIGNAVENSIKDLTEVAWFHFPFIKPLDHSLLNEILNDYSVILTYEEGIINGGFGESIMQFAQNQNYKGKIRNYGIPNQFIGHGVTKDLLDLCGLSEKKIKNEVLKYI